MNPPLNTSNHLEALKLVKDWSAGLVVVQSAAIGVVGSLLKQPPSGWHLALTIVLLSSLIFSIWVGAVWVSGTAPYIAQQLPTLLTVDPNLNIYAQKGGLTNKRGNPVGINLGDQCQLQSKLFILSLVLFSLFIIFLPDQGGS